MKKLKRLTILFRIVSVLVLMLYLWFPAIGQQTNIPRVSLMPDYPEPYNMRLWKDVARGYDSLVFDQTLQGEYLPLVFFREQATNYPGFPSFGLHTAVGTNSPESGEAINVIPAVVGATLNGIDKSDQYGHNWVLMIQEYFNRRPQENIYLNHPYSSSGNDWWYETMPNIFFMQLKFLYPEIEVFGEQLPVMADQWERAVRAMGGSDAPWEVPYMNYRAWNMEQMEPLDQGVPQPEAAGAIAWILYHAYRDTGDDRYLKGAEWAMEFLDQWPANPSYELQLPYGVYTAARMNAEVGTDYDVEKMINWVFNRGELRGWGTITGTWGGFDVDGLVGEANDQGNDYAFTMNGFQHAAALAPMVRYDSRFARAIAKWILNLANASRLFYPSFLPEDMQDNAPWARTYDPQSFIAYEALREEKYGITPYMTGDAIEGGWARTNLMLYGSSHVGYLGAIADTTNVEGILKLNILATDFYRQDAFPTWLYYNPFGEDQSVNLYLEEGTFKIYDVISKQIIHEEQSQVANITIPSGNAVMPVVVPQDATITFQRSKTLADGVIIDFDNGQYTGPYPPRIKALAAADTILLTEGTTEIFCTAEDPGEANLTYHWILPDDNFSGEDEIMFNAPAEPGIYTISCVVTNEFDLSDSLSLALDVVNKIPYEPVIHSITASPRKIRPREQSRINCVAEELNNEPLTYEWFAEAGTIEGEGEEVIFTAPEEPGNYYIKCRVSNPDNLWEEDSLLVMIRDYPDQAQGSQIAFYPLHGDVMDYSGNDLHGTPGGGLSYTSDMNDQPESAAHFNGSSAYILLPESQTFNVREQLSISFFFNTDEITSYEQHPISHGSWEHRYKVSISNQKVRFTLKTSAGTKDLDSETMIQPNEWYHVAVLYNGQDMEIWLNGTLDAFSSHEGMIELSPVQPVMGQNLPGNNDFNFKGALSLVTFFDYALSPSEIQQELLLEAPVLNQQDSLLLFLYPNPVKGTQLFLGITNNDQPHAPYHILDATGKVWLSGELRFISEEHPRVYLPMDLPGGIYFLRVMIGESSVTRSFMLIR